MDKTDVIRLLKFVSAACPAQRISSDADELWAQIVPTDFTLDECKAAVVEVKRGKPFVDVSDIVRAVMRHREEKAQAAYDEDVRRAQERARAERTVQHAAAEAATTAAGDHRLPAVYVQARETLGAPSAGKVLAAACPWCHAGPYRPCTVPGWPDQRRRLPHNARYAAAGLPEPDDEIYRRLARAQRTGTAGDMSAA